MNRFENKIDINQSKESLGMERKKGRMLDRYEGREGQHVNLITGHKKRVLTLLYSS